MEIWKRTSDVLLMLARSLSLPLSFSKDYNFKETFAVNSVHNFYLKQLLQLVRSVCKGVYVRVRVREGGR